MVIGADGRLSTRSGQSGDRGYHGSFFVFWGVPWPKVIPNLQRSRACLTCRHPCNF
jgi:hypothetical protein